MVQFVDPEVTKVKFKRELKLFEANANEYRKKGILCIGKGVLSIDLLFSVPHLKPQPIAFTVRIDYTNWDAEPPSIVFIDPFSEKKMERNKIKIRFFQATNRNDLKKFLKDFKDGRLSNNVQIPAIDLLQDHSPPFFCIPGVKEYHDHPAHSGDAWMRHRTKGEGGLCFLINQLYKHSIAQSLNYRINIELPVAQPGKVPVKTKVLVEFPEIDIIPDFNKV